MLLMALITIALIVYSVINFKNAVFLVSSVFVLQMHLTAGVVNFRMFYVISLFQIIAFLINKARTSRKLKYPLLLAFPCLFATIGYILSSVYGVCKPYAEILLSSICLFGYPVVLFYTIRTRSDLHTFLRFILYFFLVIGVYAVIEEITRYNIYSQFIDTMDANKGYFGGVHEKVRYGLRRCNSLLAFCSTLGFTSSITFFVLLYLRVNKIIINKRIENILFFLMPLCVLLSGTRSQFIVFATCLFPFVLWNKTYNTKIFRAFVVIAFVCLAIFAEYFGEVAESMMFSNEIGGSSTEMREVQLEICMIFFNKSPIWGFGDGYLMKYVQPYYPALHGAESIWFRLMVDYGIVGCITFLMIVLGCIIWLFRYDKRFIFIPLAYLIGKTFSIVVGIELTYLLIICILFQKISILYGLGKTAHEYNKHKKLLRVRRMRSVVR